MEQLTEEEKKALRGSKFAPLPSISKPVRSIPRQAHPGGPLKTNKAAALAKFLERKLQEPNGLASIDPNLVELAVKNAKQTVQRSGTSESGKVIQHFDTLDDIEVPEAKDNIEKPMITQKKKRKKNKKKKKKQKMADWEG